MIHQVGKFDMERGGREGDFWESSSFTFPGEHLDVTLLSGGSLA